MTAPSRHPSPVSDVDRETDDTARLTPHNQTAPDGQRVVDQSADTTDERAAISYAADRQADLSRAERAGEPSARFWSSRHAQIGPILALFAGVLTLAVRTWPIATPQARGTAGIPWFLLATLAGVLYIVGFFLADRYWRRARVVLVCGAILHLFFGIVAATFVNAQQVAPGPLAVLFDGVPAILALVAAFLISPPPGERASLD